MAIGVGERLPEAKLLRIGANGPEAVSLGEMVAGKRVILFGLPGAYTGTCTAAHVPSFIRTKAAFDAKGIDAILCVSVNDPFVMKSWGEATGATAAGIQMLGDAESALTLAMGMEFSAPPVGFVNRSKRYALYAEDGVVKVLHVEDSPGTCDTSGGEAMLQAI
jgi:peroxiredoxin